MLSLFANAIWNEIVFRGAKVVIKNSNMLRLLKSVVFYPDFLLKSVVFEAEFQLKSVVFEAEFQLKSVV